MEVADVQSGHGIHTYIILSKVNGNTFNVADSNSKLDEVVRRYDRKVVLNDQNRAFRLGATPSASEFKLTQTAIGSLVLGTATPAQVRDVWGTPAETWKGKQYANGDRHAPPVSFNGELWLYTCGHECETLFGFRGGKLQTYQTGDDQTGDDRVRFRSFGTGATLAQARAAGGTWRGHAFQCPAVSFGLDRDTRGVWAYIDSKTSIVYRLYATARTQVFAGCGS